MTTIGAFLIANFGLDQIIAYSTPILMLLYPLAIALIMLGLMHPWIGKNTRIYKTTVAFTMIPALFRCHPCLTCWASTTTDFQ